MMKELDKVLTQVLPATRTGQAPRADSGADENRKTRRGAADQVDAINQVFAEFELAYHNQFHKAYGQEDSLRLAKKYWLNSLREFTPEVIARAGRQLVQNSEFLPTVAAMVKACENAYPLFGLPPAQAAYIEACCAPEPRERHAWSHPAVFLAARQTGWFLLASEPQSVAFPVFEYNYQQLCRRVLRGEELHIDIPPALPETVHRPLSAEENRARLRELREKLDI